MWSWIILRASLSHKECLEQKPDSLFGIFRSKKKPRMSDDDVKVLEKLPKRMTCLQFPKEHRISFNIYLCDHIFVDWSGIIWCLRKPELSNILQSCWYSVHWLYSPLLWFWVPLFLPFSTFMDFSWPECTHTIPHCMKKLKECRDWIHINCSKMFVEVEYMRIEVLTVA